MKKQNTTTKFIDKFTTTLTTLSDESKQPPVINQDAPMTRITPFKYPQKKGNFKVTPKKQIDHTKNARGHVTSNDVEAMKRWFNDNWKNGARVIPFSILTFETWLITYFDYTFEQVTSLSERKRAVILKNYIQFLIKVSAIIQSRLFEYENLKHFMDMVKRNYNRSHTFNAIVLSLIQEQQPIKSGYLVDANIAAIMLKNKNPDIKVATSSTRLHSITSWLKTKKYVYIPAELRKGLDIESNLDMFETEDQINHYQLGYYNFAYTDIKLTPIGMTAPSDLSWFLALNDHFITAPILTPAPLIKNFEHQPHKATLTYKTTAQEMPIEVVLLVDWNLYNTYKNDSGVVNISITRTAVLINSVEITTDVTVIKRLSVDLTVAALRMTGTKILGELMQVDISVRRALEKMGSFMSKIQAAKDLYLKDNKDVYKAVFVAGKASGKTTLVNLVKQQLSSTIYIEDSDDYGKFLTYLVTIYRTGDIDKLNELITEAEMVARAKDFAKINHTAGLDTIESYFNKVVEYIIKDDVATIDWSKLSSINYALAYSDLTTRLYTKYYVHIRDLYFKWTSGKIINERFFENGIYHFLDEYSIRTYISFFHIFTSNFKRKTANVTMRYESNFDTNISLFKRIMKADKSMVSAVADTLLKMYYSQSAEHVATVTGPVAFMGLFGLLPVLSMKDSLCFEFKTHLDIIE